MWNGKLTGDVGIFVTLSGDDTIVARRSEVDFIRKGKTPTGSALEVNIRIRRRSFSGKILADSMYRYESWRQTSRKQSR